VSAVVDAMKIASSKHDLLWYYYSIHRRHKVLNISMAFSSLSDADAEHLRITPAEKADFIEEVITEISVYLGMLYHLIEIFKGYDDFADELSRCLPAVSNRVLTSVPSELGSASSRLSLQRRFGTTR
jgi:hypothetical protein